MRECNPILEITFNGTGTDTFSDRNSLSYSWDFGDGSSASGRIVKHIYTSSGTYTVYLTVTDDDGASSTDYLIINVGVDSDKDSLTNEFESGKGTNPNAWDSDGDYVADYWEIYNYYTDPTKSDSDGDGAPDWFEISYMGYDNDTDGDGIANPWDWDSDGDLIADGKEIEINSQTGDVDIKTNPLVYTNLNMTDKKDYDAVAVAKSDEIEVTVVVDYADDRTDIPVITIKGATRAGGLTIEFSIPDVEQRNEIRVKPYDPSVYSDKEEALALYHIENGKEIIEKYTGVDTENNIVWAKTSTPADELYIEDSTKFDSDGDGLKDYYERNTYHTVFSDDVEYGNLLWKTGEEAGYYHSWLISTGQAHSGTHFWYIDKSHGSIYSSTGLESERFNLPDSQWATLSFYYKSDEPRSTEVSLLIGHFRPNIIRLEPSSEWKEETIELDLFSRYELGHWGGGGGALQTRSSGDTRAITTTEGDLWVMFQFLPFFSAETPPYIKIDDITLKATTSPLNSDTDGDNLYDGWNDANHNGVWDSNEEKGEIGNPNHNGAGGYGTSPVNADMDGDGLKDSFEINGWNTYINNNRVFVSSDPLKRDSDEDGLSDWQEYRIGTKPEGDGSWDSDGDGILDIDETRPRGRSNDNRYIWIDFNRDGTEDTNEKVEVDEINRQMITAEYIPAESFFVRLNDSVGLGNITDEEASQLIYNATHDFDGDGHPDRSWNSPTGSVFLDQNLIVTSPILADTDGDGVDDKYDPFPDAQISKVELCVEFVKKGLEGGSAGSITNMDMTTFMKFVAQWYGTGGLNPPDYKNGQIVIDDVEDHLSDGFVSQFYSGHGVNPVADIDRDGYTNGEEIMMGRNPFDNDNPVKTLYYVRGSMDVQTAYAGLPLSGSAGLALYIDGADLEGATKDGQDGWVTFYLTLNLDAQLGINLWQAPDPSSVSMGPIEVGAKELQQIDIDDDMPPDTAVFHFLCFDIGGRKGVQLNRIGLTFGVGVENTIAKADINLKAIADELKDHGVDIEQSLLDLINSYGEPLPMSVNDWISAVYGFITAVLSGYYDTMVMGLDIVNGILSASDYNFANQYVRNIHFGGDI